MLHVHPRTVQLPYLSELDKPHEGGTDSATSLPVRPRSASISAAPITWDSATGAPTSVPSQAQPMQADATLSHLAGALQDSFRQLSPDQVHTLLQAAGADLAPPRCPPGVRCPFPPFPQRAS